VSIHAVPVDGVADGSSSVSHRSWLLLLPHLGERTHRNISVRSKYTQLQYKAKPHRHLTAMQKSAFLPESTRSTTNFHLPTYAFSLCGSLVAPDWAVDELRCLFGRPRWRGCARNAASESSYMSQSCPNLIPSTRPLLRRRWMYPRLKPVLWHAATVGKSVRTCD
jgi:hypothetical protein